MTYKSTTRRCRNPAMRPGPAASSRASPYRSPLLGPAAPAAERPLRRYVVQGYHPKRRYWEHVGDEDDEDRALLQALKRARVGKVAYRVWDRKKGKEVWRGYGQGARVEKWKEKRPEGLVGANATARLRRLLAARQNPLTAAETGDLARAINEMSSAATQGKWALKIGQKDVSHSARAYNDAAKIVHWLAGGQVLNVLDADLLSGPALWAKGVIAERKGRGMLANPRRARRNDYGLPKGVREVRRIGTDPFGMGTAYIEATDGNAWAIGSRLGPVNQGPVAAFIAKVKAGQLRVRLDPGVNRNAPARFRYNLHSKEERQRLEGDVLAQQGLFRGAVSRGRVEEAARILGWFQGVIAAAVASGAPPFYVSRLRVVARRLDRQLPEHPRSVGPPPEPWQTNRRRTRRNPVSYGVFAFDPSIGMSRQVGQQSYHDLAEAKRIAKALRDRRGVEVEVLGTDGSVYVIPASRSSRTNPRRPQRKRTRRLRRVKKSESFIAPFRSYQEAMKYGLRSFNCNPRSCRNPRHRHRRNVGKWSPSQVWAAAKRAGLPHEEWNIVVEHYLETGQLPGTVREVIKDWPAPPPEIWPGKGRGASANAGRNPHTGLTGLMNAREARRVERFS